MAEKGKTGGAAKPRHLSTFRRILPDFEKISEKRLRLKIPIDELCSEAGIDRRTYQRMASGATQPQFRTMRKLEKALKRLERDEFR